MQQTTMPWLQKVSHAILSEDRVYRYALYRSLDGLAWDAEISNELGVDLGIAEAVGRTTILFIMLNPSRADEDANDPTIEKLMKFSRRWGYDRLVVGNLFAYRETDSTKLASIASAKDIVGPENNAHLDRLVEESHRVVCAWGKQGTILGRGDAVRRYLLPRQADRGQALWCFKQNLDGTPCHPLYQPDAAELIEYR